ncbi:MAG TPA: hypothetical protein VKQ71_06715, partial [Acidimicrobiales bacterium]|nr:hypothetical protein [Acidimicrobiales bacterium]
MATRTITLPGESITAVHTQRVLAAASGLADCPVAPGVGTGYTPAVVGKMNGQFGATPNHFSVSATGTTMVLTIQPGVLWAVVDSGAASYDPRVLLWEMDATATATVTANASGTSRTDTVCVKLAIGTAPDTVGGNIGTIVILAGGASNALANAPVDGSLYIPLCNVVVANGATFVANANLTDKRMVHPSQARARMAATTAATSVVTGGTVQQNFDTIL